MGKTLYDCKILHGSSVYKVYYVSFADIGL